MMFICEFCKEIITAVCKFDTLWVCKDCYWHIIKYVDPQFILTPQGVKIYPDTGSTIQDEMERCMKEDRDEQPG